MYFNSIEEAYEWLDPQESDETIEHYSYAYPDQFEEWQAWLGAGHLLDGNGRDL